MARGSRLDSLSMKKPPAKKPKSKKAPKPTKAKARPKETEIELEPGMWKKFEALIRRATKMGHKPHVAKKAATKASKK